MAIFKQINLERVYTRQTAADWFECDVWEVRDTGDGWFQGPYGEVVSYDVERVERGNREISRKLSWKVIKRIQARRARQGEHVPSDLAMSFKRDRICRLIRVIGGVPHLRLHGES